MIIDYLLMFWVLPSCCVFLAIVNLNKDVHLESLGPFAWMLILTLSLFYPLGLFLLVHDLCWPFLIKKRTLIMNMKTNVYESYEEFEERENKEENGVSKEFARYHPSYESSNSTNKGCWNCRHCWYCTDCEGLSRALLSKDRINY